MPPRSRKVKALTIDTSQPNLVIVESPAKAKTISKFLGKGYEVVASMGHIRDLPKGKNAIDIQNNFAPTYEISPDKTAVVSSLKKAAKQMQKVRLATDEDREGEAIARHLCEALGLDAKKTPRIVFHEITKEAIDAAIAKPRNLDLHLVDAQQARRILDRLVGFELSPILWKKVKPQLSAGRVQSVAVRLLVEREREIQAFTPTSSFKVSGLFQTTKQESFGAELSKLLKTDTEVTDLLEACRGATFTVADVQQKPGAKNPSPPFTTSSLQQAASRLGFSVSRTMQLAQRLYEAGHITYMRTDSLQLSAQAIGSAKGAIEKKFGSRYSHPRNFSSKAKNAQEAHEAIRPTHMSTERAGEDDAQRKLYHLIRQRTLASQMAPAEIQKTVATIDFGHPTYTFVATGEVITFDGFLAVYGNPEQATSTSKKKTKDADDEESNTQMLLPALKQGDVLSAEKIIALQTLSKPPARYGEASLVKALEELGIGRPSTYAPTISTIQQRGYVENRDDDGVVTHLQKATLSKGKITRGEEKKNVGAYRKKLVPTDIGMVVNDFLVEYFPNILDYQFTAQVEEEFDEIADGKLEWHKMLATFYSPFHGTVEKVTDTAERVSGERVLGTDPVTGKVVKVRIGRFGPMVQIGESDDEEKRFASIRGNLRIESITLEQALELFALPRSLGEREGHDLKANIGRFGPYIQWNSTFASLPKGADPYTVDRETAIALIQEKAEKDQQRILQTFTYDGKEGVVMKGRRGPFVKRNRKLVKLPKGTDGATISQEDLAGLLASAKGSGKAKGAKKTKTTKKGTTTKKKSVKKSTTKRTTR